MFYLISDNFVKKKLFNICLKCKIKNIKLEHLEILINCFSFNFFPQNFKLFKFNLKLKEKSFYLILTIKNISKVIN